MRRPGQDDPIAIAIACFIGMVLVASVIVTYWEAIVFWLSVAFFVGVAVLLAAVLIRGGFIRWRL